MFKFKIITKTSETDTLSGVLDINREDEDRFIRCFENLHNSSEAYLQQVNLYAENPYDLELLVQIKSKRDAIELMVNILENFLKRLPSPIKQKIFFILNTEEVPIAIYMENFHKLLLQQDINMRNAMLSCAVYQFRQKFGGRLNFWVSRIQAIREGADIVRLVPSNLF